MTGYSFGSTKCKNKVMITSSCRRCSILSASVAGIPSRLHTRRRKLSRELNICARVVCVCSGLRVCLLEAILQARQRERGFERLKCQPEQTTNHNLHEGHAQPKRVYSPLNKFVSGSFLDANTRTSCWCVGRRCLLFLSLP